MQKQLLSFSPDKNITIYSGGQVRSSSLQIFNFEFFLTFLFDSRNHVEQEMDEHLNDYFHLLTVINHMNYRLMLYMW